jgi:hypothetical protein
MDSAQVSLVLLGSVIAYMVSFAIFKVVRFHRDGYLLKEFWVEMVADGLLISITLVVSSFYAILAYS